MLGKCAHATYAGRLCARDSLKKGDDTARRKGIKLKKG